MVVTNLNERLMLDPRSSSCQADAHPTELPGPAHTQFDIILRLEKYSKMSTELPATTRRKLLKTTQTQLLLCICIWLMGRSQLSLVKAKLTYAICEQQRHRSACASAESLISAFVIRFLDSIITAADIPDLLAFYFLSILAEHFRGQVSSWHGSINPLMPIVPLGTYANSVDPDRTPQNAASDQGLHYILAGICIRNKIKNEKVNQTPLTFEMDSSN